MLQIEYSAAAIILASVMNFACWRREVHLSSRCFLSALGHTGLDSTIEHTHTRLTALCPGLPRRAGTRKVKPISILLKQETVSGSGISWAICKSAYRSRQITTPATHHSGRMPFLPPNQQRQSTEGNSTTEQRTLNSCVDYYISKLRHSANIF